ncbi:VanZ family protein [Peribacillus sp. NPDC097295]|uniref:VanZ family protein n=1 Tax=Peribacillus sp. NPDC097295 TaxID=3364402 RepID=UPI0037F13071
MRIYFEDYIILGAAIIWLLCVLVLKIMLKRTNAYLLFFTLFYIYICELINYTQFPITIVPEFRGTIDIYKQINLIPFEGILYYPKNLILNVIMTIPFGLLLPFIMKINLRKILIFAITLPIILEGIQFLLALSLEYTERKIDINDLICNFIGTLIGYGVFKLFIYLFTSYINKKNVQLDFLTNHIASIAGISKTINRH